MKARFVISENKSEIRLENKDETVYRSKKGESSDDFFVRVANIVDEEYLEPLEISSEVSEDKLKRQSTKQLETRIKNAGKLETELIKQILTERNGGEKTDEKPAKKAEKKTAKKEKKVNQKKVVKLADAEAIRSEANAHVGKECQFTPRAGDALAKGVIKGTMLDKRVNNVYYRILGEDKKTYHKIVGSDELEILKAEK